jgi:hypothetical protein
MWLTNFLAIDTDMTGMDATVAATAAAPRHWHDGVRIIAGSIRNVIADCQFDEWLLA